MNDDKIATVDIVYNSRDIPATIAQHAEASAHLNLVTDPFHLLLSASPKVVDAQDEIIYRVQFYSYSRKPLYGIRVHDEISQGLTFLDQSALYINGQQSDQLEVNSHENQVDFMINQNVSSGDYVEIKFMAQNTSMVIGELAENQVEVIYENLTSLAYSNKVNVACQTAELEGALYCIDQRGCNIDRVKTYEEFYYMLEMNNMGNCCVHTDTWGITMELPKGFGFSYDRRSNLPCILIGEDTSPDNAFPLSSNLEVSVIDEMDNYTLSIKHLDILTNKKMYLFMKGFYNHESIYTIKKNKICIKYEYELERTAYCKKSKECFMNETVLKVYDPESKPDNKTNNWVNRGNVYITEYIRCPRNWRNVGLIRCDSQYSVDHTEIILRRGIGILRIYGYSYYTIRYLWNGEEISYVLPFQIELPNYYDQVSKIELLPCRYNLRKMNGCTVRIRSAIDICSYRV